MHPQISPSISLPALIMTGISALISCSLSVSPDLDCKLPKGRNASALPRGCILSTCDSIRHVADARWILAEGRRCHGIGRNLSCYPPRNTSLTGLPSTCIFFITASSETKYCRCPRNRQTGERGSVSGSALGSFHTLPHLDFILAVAHYYPPSTSEEIKEVKAQGGDRVAQGHAEP